MRLGHPSNVKSSLTATRHVIRAVTKFQLPLAVNQAYRRQRSPNPFALKSMHPVLSGTLCKPLLRVQNTHHSVTRSTIQAHVAKNFKPFKVRCPFSPVYPPFCMSHILLSFIYVPCIALLVCSFPSHPLSFSVWLSSSYSALLHTGRTRPPGPHPVPCIPIITRAHTRWSRYHQARLTAFTPWARLTLMPRALTSAHPQSSITSPPHLTPPRRPHPHRSMGRSPLTP
jgi:hypothetical protein